MSSIHGLKCDGCTARLAWTVQTGEPRFTKAVLEQAARDLGWQAPDKTGNHWCWNCRSEVGRDQWRRRMNLKMGLSVDYGRGRCTCTGSGDSCSRAGHPGVVPLSPGSRSLELLKEVRGNA
jgi:hypothetical protein